MKRGPGGTAVVYLGALVLAIFTLGPLVLVFLASVLPEAGLIAVPPRWFQFGFTFDNYDYIFTGTIPQSYLVKGAIRSMISQEVRLIPPAMLNSFLVAFAVMLLNWIAGCPAAFAYARFSFPGRRVSFFFVMASRLIPTVALAVAYYAIVQQLGLLDSHMALIAIYAVLTLPFTLLILTLYFRGIPREIEEAAELDGCSPMQTLVRITAPLALPGLIGTGLFAFMLSYSEFLFALLITTSIKSRTLPVILGSISLNPDVSWGLMNASIAISILPTLLLVVPVWRYMVRGLLAGGIG
ncbi:MAG: carbohydrate ABC transporter permease [Nitrospinota bacterium]|nr:MAG: carbohydrate ABC transporter permease [Nitrospinota bacterium]